jgi:hypothetical protein
MLYHLDRHPQPSLGVGIDLPVQDVVRGKKKVAEIDFVHSAVRQVRMVVEPLLFVSREQVVTAYMPARTQLADSKGWGRTAESLGRKVENIVDPDPEVFGNEIDSG